MVSYEPYTGTYHASEIAYVFGTTSLLNGPSDTPEQQEFTSYIQGAWAAFAKDPDNGLVDYGWPKYNPNSTSLLQLGLNGTVGPNLINPSQYDSLCPGVDTLSDVLAQIEALAGDLSTFIAVIF